MKIKKSLKGPLAGLLVGAGALMPIKSNADGSLDVYNYTSDPSIYYNGIHFLENQGDGQYLNNFPPSLETYYKDDLGNKHTSAGVNLSSSKTYTCPLEGIGDIPNGVNNELAFSILSPFPTNTLIDAKIVVGSITNYIPDLVAFCSTNTPDEWGYVHFQLPSTTNVSNRVYGSVTMTFGPAAPQTYNVNIENGAKYNLSPTNFTGVANGGSVTSTAANVYYTNSPGIRTKIIGLEKKLP